MTQYYDFSFLNNFVIFFTSDDGDRSSSRSTILKQLENYKSFRPGKLERNLGEVMQLALLVIRHL